MAPMDLLKAAAAAAFVLSAAAHSLEEAGKLHCATKSYSHLAATQWLMCAQHLKRAAISLPVSSGRARGRRCMLTRPPQPVHTLIFTVLVCTLELVVATTSTTGRSTRRARSLTWLASLRTLFLSDATLVTLRKHEAATSLH